MKKNPPPGLPQTTALSRAVPAWLYICAALVFMMIIVGAVTRLTESGLSIVEWKPVMGAIPPLNEEAWQAEFDLYRQSPEYQKKNFWMGLADFKKIYFWEWFHRLLGRIIGIAYALPFFWFLCRGAVPKEKLLALCGLLALGGAQGFMGWYMVKSGLVDIPAVSHYRLAAHLSLAFLILGLLVWVALSWNRVKGPRNPALLIHSAIATVLFAVTMIWGAFTAGLDAGLIYNETFPKMGGQWLPPDMGHLKPVWMNILALPSGVQFTHRWLAVITVIVIAALWLHGVQRQSAGWALHLLGIAVFLQMGLGIATLLSGVFLPLAVLHQAGAACVMILLVINLRRYAG